MCSEIEGLYDKIIVTIVPSYTRIKCIIHLLPLALFTNKITRTGSDLFVLISACISRKRMKICFKRNASKAALDGVISAPFGAESTYTV